MQLCTCEFASCQFFIDSLWLVDTGGRLPAGSVACYGAAVGGPLAIGLLPRPAVPVYQCTQLFLWPHRPGAQPWEPSLIRWPVCFTQTPVGCALMSVGGRGLGIILRCLAKKAAKFCSGFLIPFGNSTEQAQAGVSCVGPWRFRARRVQSDTVAAFSDNCRLAFSRIFTG